MERLNRREVEQILGIYPPFRIKDMILNLEQEVLEVQIEETNKKTRNLFANTKQNTRKVRWHHTKTGRFDTVIELHASKNAFSKHRTLNPPAFIGPENAQYTYQLQQAILLAAGNSLNSETIHSLTGVSRSLISQIIADNQEHQQESKVQSQLPLETDPIWRNIIKHEVSFKTNFPPLKFLISRLELTCFNNIDDPSIIQDSVSTLRQFFIKNRTQLKSEYAQIGVIEQPRSQAQANQTSSNNKNKKVTLTIDHPIWHSILSGEVDLLSKNTGLNLYIAQLKNLYRKSDITQTEQFQISKELLSYLKKNMAKLKPELMSISKMVRQLNEQSTEKELPDNNHNVWQDIVQGRIFIESNQMALKLLLVKARAAEDISEGSEMLHQYFTKNLRALTTEVKQIEEHLAVAS
ncbi:hypothetical protein NBRC116188_06940 [Oceaniserpentilla sp. 4NH20-0058]|uniref:hypothetical protein n=1 Tax=Oceaniserpentilla sp. 4NH20-0058 TaxID=3127660 RepID=UPI0031069CB3